MDIAPVLPHLSLSLLGPLRVTLNGESVTTFDSAKVRALLVYLAAEADRPRPRDVLAGLLWPDFPQRTALANLRYALSNLRKAIGDRDAQPPFLLITTDALQFNRASVHTLDLHDFSESVAAGTVERWQQAAALYRGPFLEGFAVGDSAAFEEWLVLKREQLGRQMISALRRLADHFEVRGEYEYAQQYTWRLLELEPWQEEGHQQLMRLLALGGQRGAALAQYESCRRLLADELGVEPSVETTALYERIRGGLLSAWTGHPTLPVFLSPQTPLVESERPLFVARQPELDRLDQLLTRARAGHGRVAFISGEPGSGKTMLLQEFTRRALVAHPDLIAISGYCNAYTGIGDPYLPFLEMLEMLTGDVEAQWTGGGITGEHAQRLWALLPETLSALMRDGPGLIDRFVAGGGLLARAQIGAPVQADPLNELLKRRAASTGAANLQQTDLFAQYTKVLHALARKRPLLLTIDDLQWADIGSVSLLFHLGRRLAGERILLLCAYRSSDLAAGRAGERHPVEPVVNELQRIYGDEPLDLAQADGHCFVETLLDAEPNRLAASFRATLHRHTSGHPLFTVELLRGLQARGDLMKDEAGCWTEAASIQWEKLPPRLEAVIAERIGRLSALLQTTLTVASVEGADFTLEAVARAQAVDAGEILRRLSGPLGKEHQLVAASGGRQLAEGYLSTYRFRHFLFQKYLYNRLDEVERRHWHQALGNALEALHGRQANEIAAQLARHFESARLPTRAVGYLLAAGHKAAQLSAHAEAIAHYRRGLELLPALPDSPERAQQELALQMSLGVSLAESRGYADPEMGRAYGRAWELCRQLGTTPELFPVLTGLGGFYSLRAENQTARLVYEEILAVAQRTTDPALRTIGHWGIGYLLVVTGEFVVGRAHLEQALAFYDPAQHRSLASVYYQDPGVSCLVWLSWALWALGYPDQARQRSREALALAQELGHPFTQAFALGLAAAFHFFRREPLETEQQAEAAIAIASHNGFPFWASVGMVMRRWALAHQKSGEAGQSAIREAIAFARASGAKQPLPTWLMAGAEVCARRGLVSEGLDLLAEAQTEIDERGGCVDEAEVYRLRGELLLQSNAEESEADACFQKAVEIARRQQAKSWELRATVSLCRLWQRQGQHEKARRRLAECYGWFTEGFATPDLQEAAKLLDELTRPYRG